MTCGRPPTRRSGDGLSKDEMREGAVELEKKIALHKPEAVVIVGKSIWETIWMVKKGQNKFKDPDFHWGWQDVEALVDLLQSCMEIERMGYGIGLKRG